MSYLTSIGSFLVAIFGSLFTAWKYRDNLYNIWICRDCYKYPDVTLKPGDNYKLSIQLNSLTTTGVKNVFAEMKKKVNKRKKKKDKNINFLQTYY